MVKIVYTLWDSYVDMRNFVCTVSAEDNQKKRKTATIEQDKAPAAKKKAPDEKKPVGFDRGLQPEKILGKNFFFWRKCDRINVNVCLQVQLTAVDS